MLKCTIIGCLFVLLIVLSATGCRKNNSSSTTSQTDSLALHLNDSIPPGLEDFLDTVTKTTPADGSAYLPDGLTVDSVLKLYDLAFYQKTVTGAGSGSGNSTVPYSDNINYLIAHMLKMADLLCTHSIHLHGTQTSFAYVSGSKDTITPRQATEYQGKTKIIGTCTQFLYGLDCSGFVAQCLQAAGLSLPLANSSVYNLINMGLIFDALGTNSTYQNVSYTEIDNITDAHQLQFGDIIYSSDFDHIGIFGQNAQGQPVIMQCNGRFSYTCAENASSGRGPNAIPFSAYSAYFFGGGAGVTLSAIRFTHVDMNGMATFDQDGDTAKVYEGYYSGTESVGGAFADNISFYLYYGSPTQRLYAYQGLVTSSAPPSNYLLPYRLVGTGQIQLDERSDGELDLSGGGQFTSDYYSSQTWNTLLLNYRLNNPSLPNVQYYYILNFAPPASILNNASVTGYILNAWTNNTDTVINMTTVQ
jgi:hypothetical protein